MRLSHWVAHLLRKYHIGKHRQNFRQNLFIELANFDGKTLPRFRLREE